MIGERLHPLYHGVGCLSGDPDPLETLGLQLLGQRGLLVPGLAHGSTEVARWLCSCPQEHQRSQGWGSIRACRAVRILAKAWGCWGQFRKPGGGARLRNRAGTSGALPLSCLLGPSAEPRAWENYAGTETGRGNPCSPSSRCQGWQEAKQLLRTPAGLPPGAGTRPGLGLQRPGLALHPLLLRFALNQGTPREEGK